MNKTTAKTSVTEQLTASPAVVTEQADISPYTPSSISYLGNSQHERVRPRPLRPASNLDRAFAAISATLSEDLRDVERSNSFDEWKETLDQEVLNTLQRSAGSRQILGILLAAARQKDVVDFNANALKSFRAITNVLRRPNASISDVRIVIKFLKIAGIEALLPLEPTHFSLGDELDTFLDDLIAKHS